MVSRPFGTSFLAWIGFLVGVLEGTLPVIKLVVLFRSLGLCRDPLERKMFVLKEVIGSDAITSIPPPGPNTELSTFHLEAVLVLFTGSSSV